MIPQGHRDASRSWPGRGLVLLAMVALSAVFGPASPARAARVDLRQIDPELAELPFGEGIEAVSAWIGKRLDRAYRPRIARAADANERARLKERRDQELALMRADEQVFDGRPTGLDSSIIAGEFGVGTDESLLRYQEGEESHYFFMHQGKLWKYARRIGGDVTFMSRLTTFQGPLGEPVGLSEESDGEGGRRLVSATWQNLGFDYRLLNRRTIYGSDLFIMEDRTVATALSKLRKQGPKPAKKKADPSLEDFFLEDPDTYGAPPTPSPPPAPDEVSGPGPKPVP